MKYDNGAQGWNGRIIVDYTVKNYLVLLIYVVHHFFIGRGVRLRFLHAPHLELTKLRLTVIGC